MFFRDYQLKPVTNYSQYILHFIKIMLGHGGLLP
jgi:hypothetical protein